MVCLIAISVIVRVLVNADSAPFAETAVAALSSQLSLLAVMVILMPAFLRDTLKLSNRFAGPMFRLRTVLAEMAKGNEGTKIKFRAGDFWLPVADDFNTVIDQINDLKARNQQLESENESLRATSATA